MMQKKFLFIFFSFTFLFILFSLTLILGANEIPQNGIVATNSSTISVNFNLCNGSDSTPDLRDSFIIGVNASSSIYNFSQTSGSINHSHTYNSGGGGSTLVTAPANILFTPPPSGIYTPGGSATLSAGNYNPTNNIPSSYSVNFLQANQTTNVVSGIIVWWNGTTSNVPSGWSVNTNIYNRFLKGANSTNLGTIGGATTHSHGGTASGSWIFQAAPNTPLVAGSSFGVSGSWTGTITSSIGDITPLYYGLIPIISDGTTGVSRGMIIAYNGSLANLPATWSEYTNARNRYIKGNSVFGTTGGSLNFSHTHTGAAGGSTSPSGSNFGVGSGNATWTSTVVISANSPSSSSSSWQPKTKALYYIVNNEDAPSSSPTVTIKEECISSTFVNCELYQSKKTFSDKDTFINKLIYSFKELWKN